jgi:hypothetical protein
MYKKIYTGAACVASCLAVYGGLSWLLYAMDLKNFR